jgi:DNA replication and repair protein RecF
LVIQEIYLRGWRNINLAKLDLGRKISVFFGKNGQGKSNLLEAVYTLVAFRSFRTNSLSDVIRWENEAADLEGKITLRGFDRTLKLRIVPGKRQATLDEKSVRRDSEQLSGLGVVAFSPDDLDLAKGPAAERRRYMDRIIFGIHRAYAREAVGFERALKARNKLLKEGRNETFLLGSYDDILATTGARIVFLRKALVRELDERFKRVFREIHSEKQVGIRYKTAEQFLNAETESEIRNALAQALEATQNKDKYRGFTTVGPHTDDLDIRLEARNAGKHGSQGQLRSIVMALKMAELELIAEKNAEQPVFILDDVTSELDEERRKKLLTALVTMSCQTLISVTERQNLPSLLERKDWEVKEGCFFAF